MIVRATKPLAPNTELSFPYVAPLSLSTSDASPLAKKFKSWGFICSCDICADMRDTPWSVVQRRQSLLRQFKDLCDTSSSLSGLPAKKMQRVLTALNDTYTSPAEQVPRFALFDPLLLLTRVHMDRDDFANGLDAVTQTLRTLGFVTTGRDRNASAEFQIVTWGHLLDVSWKSVCMRGGRLGFWGWWARRGRRMGLRGLRIVCLWVRMRVSMGRMSFGLTVCVGVGGLVFAF